MKYLLIILGVISLTLGIIGICLPVLPTTPFLLLSSFLFARSSNKLYNWLLNHKVLGEYIRGFLQEKRIPLHIKIYSISILWITMICSMLFAVKGKPYLQILLAAIAVAITMHILSYKTKINNINMKTKKFQNWWKYSGILLIATGIIHTIVGLIMGRHIYWEILKLGFVNAIEPDFVRAFGFWFLICGIILIIFGQTLHYFIKKTGRRPPLSLGYAMLIFSIFGCLAMPASGFWLFLPQSLIIIFAQREKA
jgi:uncharacterized membrane protein YbaN (DUF454 family)